MAVISISLDEALLEELDALEDEYGFTGRSELIRTALRAWMQDADRRGFDDVTDGVIFVKCEEDTADHVSSLLHEHRSVIVSQIHQHLEDHVCFELLVVDGDPDTIEAFWQDVQASRHVRTAEFIPL